MPFIKNYDSISTNENRRIVLDLIEKGLSSIQPQEVLRKNFHVRENILLLKDKRIDLKSFKRVFLLGFGKGSAKYSSLIEKGLHEFLTEGFVIDTEPEDFIKIEFTKGSHPLPSGENIEFTKNTLERLSSLTQDDLVIVIICGGGSVMFELPHSLSFDRISDVNKALLESGADITEMNTLRKHLSQTKGGGLVQKLHPAKILSLIFSDVPGNDLSFIASGPTVKDETSINDALEIVRKFNLERLNLTESDFIETPKDNNIFENTDNLLMLNNMTALFEMKKLAQGMGLSTTVFSDHFKGVSSDSGKILIDETPDSSILLAGGETTVVVKGNGTGGRNQELVLGSLSFLDENVTIASINSDGWDNSPSAGAIGDFQTVNKAKEKGLDPNKYLSENNSLVFFQEVGDAIITERLPSNVADFMVVYKK